METVKEGESGYRIYIKDNVPLNRSDREAYDYLGIEPAKVADAKKRKRIWTLKYGTSCAKTSMISVRSAP